MKHRGFTLVELLVALASAAVLITMTMALFIAVRQESVRGSVRNEMSRDGQLILDTVEHDLNFLGAGVPRGTCQDPAPCNGDSLLPVIRIGDNHNLAFVGDLPYPSAEFNGSASITRFIADATNDQIAVSSEISGSCTPWTTASAAGFHCSTKNATLIPATYVAGDDCSEGQPAARTCPWAMNKWVPAGGGFVQLIAVDTAGNWYERRLVAAGIGDAQTPYWGIHFDHNFPIPGAPDLPRNAFFGVVGDSTMAQLDRVFFALEDAGAPGTECAGTNCVLKRKQCWGLIQDTNAAGFPPAGTGAFFGSTSAIANCDETLTPPDGTPWETIATGIQSLTFSYFQRNAALAIPLSVANARLVRAIDLRAVLSRTAAGQTLTETVTRRIFLENRETP